MSDAPGRAAETSRTHVHTEPVEITGIATGGAGVGRLADGRVVFIHGTAPGDRVEARVTQTRKRWARAHAVRVLEAGPGRREPPCPFYASCGGCTLQHMSYETQIDAKALVVRDALRRIGGVDPGLPSIVGSPTEFEYRNRMSFHLRRLDADRVLAGLHERDRPDRLIDIDSRCLLPEPPIREAWAGLRKAWGASAQRLPAGESLRLTLQSTASGEVGLLVEDGFGEGRPEEILTAVPGIAAIWKTDGDGQPVHLAGTDALPAADGVDLEAGVFTQVNRAVAALLDAHVDALLGDVTGARIIDAYCGVGVRTIRLAAAGAGVTGIEADRSAVDEARRRAAGRAWVIHGLVEDHLAGSLPADVVILNPPRAGLATAVCDTLLAKPPARLIYVSCDPATLARDCARLAARFTMTDVRCFDMFPQTAHVETVVDLQCATT